VIKGTAQRKLNPRTPANAPVFCGGVYALEQGAVKAQGGLNFLIIFLAGFIVGCVRTGDKLYGGGIPHHVLGGGMISLRVLCDSHCMSLRSHFDL
jgi:hypothetical protein